MCHHSCSTYHGTNFGLDWIIIESRLVFQSVLIKNFWSCTFGSLCFFWIVPLLDCCDFGLLRFWIVTLTFELLHLLLDRCIFGSFDLPLDCGTFGIVYFWIAMHFWIALHFWITLPFWSMQNFESHCPFGACRICISQNRDSAWFGSCVIWNVDLVWRLHWLQLRSIASPTGLKPKPTMVVKNKIWDTSGLTLFCICGGKHNLTTLVRAIGSFSNISS